MYKMIAMLRRKPGISREEFARYWIDIHAPLVKDCLPGLQKYVLNIATPFPDGREPDYDGVVELGFEDQAAMTAAMTSPTWLSTQRQASTSNFLDLENILSVHTEEHVVV